MEARLKKHDSGKTVQRKRFCCRTVALSPQSRYLLRFCFFPLGAAEPPLSMRAPPPTTTATTAAATEWEKQKYDRDLARN
jgi:hypothetical protein